MNLRLLNPLRWKKTFLVGLLVLFLIIWFGFFDTYSLYTRYQLNMEKNELIKNTEELRAESEILEEKIEAIESNPLLLEEIAREEYGMRKPGETVYRVREK
ncbi:MAG: septum formation initiator family protein [Balneolales bacterium]